MLIQCSKMHFLIFLLIFTEQTPPETCALLLRRPPVHMVQSNPRLVAWNRPLCRPHGADKQSQASLDSGADAVHGDNGVEHERLRVGRKPELHSLGPSTPDGGLP